MSEYANMRRKILNSMYGKFASGRLADTFYPGVSFYDWTEEYRTIDPVKTATIPALDVPPAPKEPEAAPESASVQMLCALMADRVAEKERVEAAVKSRDKQIEDAQRRIDELTKRNEDDRRHIGAAVAAIAAVEVDIAKLTT